MTDLQPNPTVSKTKISTIWIVPIFAALVGIWMVVDTYLKEGPTITVSFHTAEGLVAGKTKVRILNVEIGLIESVDLNDDLNGVIATIKLHPSSRPLLTEDARFWVVKARIGTGGISGLGTLLSGAYVEFEPGLSKKKRRNFVGLEEPPSMPAGTPGLRLHLTSEKAGSLNTGNGVFYRGYKVGRIEKTRLNVQTQQIEYELFVNAPFNEFVTSTTRFWNSSGISMNASADGLDVRMSSLDSILLGGVTFDTPEGLSPGEPVADETEFRLYDSYDNILQNPFKYGTYYVVSFTQSLRGLVPGAPVEYRGIQLGHVKKILMKGLIGLNTEKTSAGIPVLIYLEPGRMEIPDTEGSNARIIRSIQKGVPNGLRASLETASLITGRQLISLDYYPNAEQQQVGKFLDYPTIPTIETGVGRLEQQISSFLDKLDKLPLTETVSGANKVIADVDDTVVSLTNTLNAIDLILRDDGTKSMPDEVTALLRELRNTLAGFSQDSEMYHSLNTSVNSLNETLENLNELSRKLSDKPNSVIFPASHKQDPIPEAAK